jgi:aminoglycoside 2'-N-acetyltransferase I
MPSVTELRTAHTADLDASTTSAIRDLMDVVFDGVSDDTFDNTLGGVHALIVEDGELIAHGSVVQRRLLHAGRALRTGYVEGVAVRSDHRRQGHGGTVMAELERVIRSAYHLGHDTRRDQAHRRPRRRRLRPAGIGAGRCGRRAHLRLPPRRAVVKSSMAATRSRR